MALFSDVDWVIIVAVGAFLFLGPNNQGLLRQLGRLYARAMGLKNELLGEVAKSAGLPPPTGSSGSVRGLVMRELNGPDRASATAAVPLFVTQPPPTAIAAVGALPSMMTVASSGSIGAGTWSVTGFPVEGENGGPPR
jgi:hypothetical protein